MIKTLEYIMKNSHFIVSIHAEKIIIEQKVSEHVTAYLCQLPLDLVWDLLKSYYIEVDIDNLGLGNKRRKFEACIGHGAIDCMAVGRLTDSIYISTKKGGDKNRT